MTEKTRAIRPRQRFEAHTGRVYGVIHLPGGRRIMTCSDDGSLRVWNSQSGQKIGHDWRDGGSAVYTIALSPDGKKVVSGSADGALRLWDIDTGKVITKWSGNWFIVRCVCWSRDGGRVLSGTWDGTARVWNVESGETILAIKTGLANMEAVIYSPNETMIAAGGDSAPESKEKEFLKIWDAKTGKFIINLKGHAKLVYCLAWTTDRSTLISGSLDSSIRTWDTTTWQQIHVLTGPIVTVRAIAISPNDRILASVSIITAQLWNLENGQPIGSPLKHAHPMNCVSFSADGKLLATGSWDNDAYTWDVPAIIREAGCNELLSDREESLLDVVGTRRPDQPRRENVRRFPPGFFDDSSHHPRSAASHLPLPSSTPKHHSPGGALLDRVFSLFRRTHDNTYDTLPQPGFSDWVRNSFPVIPRSFELQGRRATVVDVPFTRGKRRNVSAAEVRFEREKARNAKKASAGSSRPPKNSVAQQSDEAAHTQLTSSVTPAVAATSGATTSTTLTITDAGCWTRFRLSICCVSAQYTDGHH